MPRRKLGQGRIFVLFMDTALVLLARLSSTVAEPIQPNTTSIRPSTTTAPFDMHSCVAHADGIYADPFDCHRYYHCVRQKTFYFRCFDGFVFDPCRRRCVYQSACIPASDQCSSATTTPTSVAGIVQGTEISKNVIRVEQTVDLQMHDKNGEQSQKNGSRLVKEPAGNNGTAPTENTDKQGSETATQGTTTTGGTYSATTMHTTKEHGSDEEAAETTARPKIGSHDVTKPYKKEPDSSNATADSAADTSHAKNEPTKVEKEKASNDQQAESQGNTTSAHKRTSPHQAIGEDEDRAATTSHQLTKSPVTEVSETSGHATAETNTTSSVHRGKVPAGHNIGEGASTGHNETQSMETTGEQGNGEVPRTTSSYRGQTYLVRVIFNRRINSASTNGSEDKAGSENVTNSWETTTKSTVKQSSENSDLVSENSTTRNKHTTSSVTASSAEAVASSESTKGNGTVANETDGGHSTEGGHNGNKTRSTEEEPSERNGTNTSHLKSSSSLPSKENGTSNEEETDPTKPVLTEDKVGNTTGAKRARTTAKNATKSAESSEENNSSSNEKLQSNKNKTESLARTVKDEAGSSKCSETAVGGKNNRRKHESKNSTEEMDEDLIPPAKNKKRLLHSLKNEKYISRQPIAKLADLLAEINITTVCRTPSISQTIAPASGDCQCSGPEALDDSVIAAETENQTQPLRSHCRALVCFNGAMYIELSNGQCGCLCPVGWRGDRCQHLVDHSTCHCANGGRCVSVENGTYACLLCPLGYVGGQCQYAYPASEKIEVVAKLELCSSEASAKMKCKNGGICIQDSAKGHGSQCYCPPDFAGEQCQKKV